MNRREFLKFLTAGTGAAMLGSNVVKALASPELPAPLRTPAAAADRDPVYHALNRWGFGARPGQADLVRKMGLEAYLNQQLDHQTLDDSDVERLLGELITLDMTASEMYAVGKRPQEVIVELIGATLVRAVYSPRQLYEVMVNFWSEHFSIYHLKGQCSILKTPDDREVVRPYALGKFRDLLGASAKSPAMLVYLDNAQSRKEHPNENYARELLELHTVTIGNYTEDDVKELARVLTGWTVRPRTGEYLFSRAVHDSSSKTVMGVTFPAGGWDADGEKMLDLLSRHPGTARHIASKLLRRFVQDDPTESMVQTIAQVFLNSDGDIKTVLRAIFALPEFWNAPPKYKRPFEYVISLLRGFDAAVGGTPAGRRNAVGDALSVMGHLPFNHPTPDGYNDNGSYWVSNMLPRWNLAIATAYNQAPGLRVNLIRAATSKGIKREFGEIAGFYVQTLLGRGLSEAEYQTIFNYATKGGVPTLEGPALAETAALIAASPAFQYR